ncbi:unnamed protein product [Mycena citricolor]|uniref:YTH domain-containing protein n=1 Tax=Mycena citricolor TaxID=2018698 RepID=A0AAD2Q763_9AGAR|nr:unnamed protein product [Mycena citricolor]CAK5283853.1 unnamed protein product [Mycena citricolor]
MIETRGRPTAVQLISYASSQPSGSTPSSNRNQYESHRPSERRVYHPAAPADRSQWAMWMGNVPKHADEHDLQTFIAAQNPDHGVLSVFLISKSSCAFVNFASEAHLNDAIKQCNGKHLGPDWTRGPPLVCRVRTLNDDLWTGVGGQRGVGLHRQWINSRIAARDGIGDADSPSAASDASTTSSFFEKHFPRRFFVLKSQTREELDRCVEDGVWFIQTHNGAVLDRAFRTSDETILFFSVNKSGQFYGYARMRTSVMTTNDAIHDGLPPDTMVAEKSPSPFTPSPSPPGITQSAPSVMTPAGHPDLQELYEAGKGVHQPISLDGLLQRHQDILEARLEPEPDDHPEPSPMSDGVSGYTAQITVEWICLEPLPFKRTRNIVNTWNRDREVKISRDGTELDPNAGLALLEAWRLVQDERRRRQA